MSKTKIIIGVLTILVLVGAISTVIYTQFKGKLQIRLDDEKTVFYVNETGRFIITGTEWSYFYKGSKQLERRRSKINITRSYDPITGIETQTRVTPYYKEYSRSKNGPVKTDEYIFLSDVPIVEQFPAIHRVTIENGSGYIYQYDVKDLFCDRQTTYNVQSPQSFGKNMKVEWQDGNYYAKVYRYKNKDKCKLTVKYRITSDHETILMRLYDPPTYATGITHAYSFNNGNANDDINDNDGNVHGATLTSSGYIGQAYSFDGTDDHINLSDTVYIDYSVSSNFSWSFWVYLNSEGVFHGLISKMISGEIGLQTRILDDDRIQLSGEDSIGGNDNFVSTMTFSDDTWYHVVWVSNTTDNMLLYVDGSSQAFDTSSSAASTNFANEENFTLGRIAANYLNGILDEVIIWNKTLSPAEVTSLYNSYLSGESLVYFNLSFNGVQGNVNVEYGEPINITANISIIDEVCVDVFHSEYGLEYSCGINTTSFIFNPSYYEKKIFADGTDKIKLDYSGAGNQTFNISAHQFDNITSLTINLTGYVTSTDFPKDVKIYINGSLSNNLGFIYNTSTTRINTFNDSTTAKNSSLTKRATFTVAYLKIPADSQTSNGTMSLQGLTYLGDETDGALTISSSQTINAYSTLVENETIGTVTIQVNSSSGFSVDDEVLLIQMQHTSNAGLYEFKTITAIDGNEITFAKGISRAYYSGEFNQSGANSAQIVTVPHYTSVTVNAGQDLDCEQWDGYDGGIVVFRSSGTVKIDGDIDCRGNGYRGHHRIATGSEPGYQGESWNGTGIQSELSNGGAGGGGNTSCIGVPCGVNPCEASGGGGAYAANGLAGGESQGGTAYGTVTLERLYMGSAGGGGGDGAYDDTLDQLYGGDGGGIILVYAKNVTVTGSIDSRGTNGNAGYLGQRCDAEPGGGGAGGSIHLIANSVWLNGGWVNATNGLAGVMLGATERLGNGSVGRIATNMESKTGTTNPVSYDRDMLSINNSLAHDLWLEVGAIDGIREWNNTATFNISADVIDFRDAINTYTGECTADSDGFCFVPVYIFTANRGVVELKNINITYDNVLNPITLDSGLVRAYVGNSTGETNITITIENSVQSQINVTAPLYYYAGGNYTLKVSAHRSNNTINKNYNVTSFRSKFINDLPYTWTDAVFFQPLTNSSKNLTPFAQRTSTPIFNITGKAYNSPGMLFGMNATIYTCADLSFSDDSGIDNATILDGTFFHIKNTTDLVGNWGAWAWVDLDDCDANETRLLRINETLKSCCHGCLDCWER